MKKGSTEEKESELLSLIGINSEFEIVLAHVKEKCLLTPFSYDYCLQVAIDRVSRGLNVR